VWDARTGLPIGSLDDLSSRPTLDRSQRYVTAIQGERRVQIWDLVTDAHTTFIGETLQSGVVDPTTKFVVGVSAQGNAVVVLDTEGRTLARWPIAHDQPIVSQGRDSQYQVRAPDSAAWWVADDTIITQSARLALWKTSSNLDHHADLVHKHVPWRLENDRLVPVLARVHGTVWRGAERVPHASVGLEIRKPPDVFESGSISYRGTDTKITRATLSSDTAGRFQGSGLAPGDYTLTVKDGAQTHQTNVTVTVEDEAVDIHLDELPAMP
jgi:hypothetical protein